MISEDLMKSLLDRALEAEIGIEVDSSHNVQLRNKLYEFRKGVPNTYDELMLFMPTTGKLWIVKKATEMPEDA